MKKIQSYVQIQIFIAKIDNACLLKLLGISSINLTLSFKIIIIHNVVYKKYIKSQNIMSCLPLEFEMQFDGFIVHNFFLFAFLKIVCLHVYKLVVSLSSLLNIEHKAGDLKLFSLSFR